MADLIEIKARSDRQDFFRKKLLEYNADFKGMDHQIDTYFNVPNGRLKLREGNIENHLIHYHRKNQKGPKHSLVTLYASEPKSSLKKILKDSLGILIVVDKKREIYFIDNVKFHIDIVKGLGTFVEIEAIDRDGSISKEKLQEQCECYIRLFEINPEDLVDVSYSDLLLSSI